MSVYRYLWKPHAGFGMLTLMPPKKKPGRLGKKPKNPGMLMLRMDDATVAALEAYLGAQKVPPERTAVALVALRQFLTAEGFLKAPAK
jgi:hypothetical protein